MTVLSRIIVISLMLFSAAWAKGKEQLRYGGYILADGATTEASAAQLSLAMLRLFEASLGEENGVWVPLELRFDAGQLRKRDLSRARNHFDEMLRRIDKGEFDEAYEQVFRAERFARKGFPYSVDFNLFSEILYYRAAVDLGMGKTEGAQASYCNYLYLMTNLSRSSVSVGQKLPNMKACSAGEETGELVIKSRVDGGIVYLNGVSVGVASRGVPYSAPFLARGTHFVELRKPGFARWGEVVEIKPGKSVKKKARLKRPRAGVNGRELDPLNELVLAGPEKSDMAFLQEQLFQYADRVGVDVLVFGKVRALRKGAFVLNILKFDQNGVKTANMTFDPNGFEFDLIMLSALRQLDLPVRSVASPNQPIDSRYLFFKVR